MMPITKPSVVSKLFVYNSFLFFLTLLPNAAKAQCNFSASLIYNPDPICYGDSVIFNTVTLGGTPPLTYSWNTPLPPNGLLNDSTMYVIANGGFNTAVTITDDNGCTTTVSFSTKPPLTHMEVDYEVICLFPGYAYQLTVTGITSMPLLWSTGETTTQIIGFPGFSYSVTATSPNGCTRTIVIPTLPFLTNYAPSVDLTGPSEICENVQGELTTTSGPWFYEWSTGQSGTENSVSFTGPGVYVVTVSSSNNICPAVDSIEILPTPPTPPLIELSTDFVCPGKMGTIYVVNSSAYQQFSWSNGQTSPSILAEGGLTFTVTVTEPNGCTAVTSSSIDVFPVTDPILAALPNICVGQEEMEWQVVPSIFTHYAWSTGETTPTIIVADIGTYSLTVTDVNGCTTTTEQVVEAAPMPSPSIPPVVTSCNGAPQQLSVAGGPFQSYLWSNGANTSTIQVSQGGTYVVTVTNLRGCSASASTTVVLGTPPTASVNATQAACDGNVTLTASGGADYLWSTGATTSSITTSNNGIFTVTVTDAGGCTATATQDINNPAPPQVLITGPTGLCAGIPANMQASAGFASYAWSTGANTPTITVTQGGSYTVTATSATGCTFTDNILIDALLSPTVTIGGPTSFCANSNAVLTLSGNYSSLAWSNGASTPSLTVSQPGTYAVTVSNGQGCSATASQTVTTTTSLSFTIVEAIAVCDGIAQLSAGGGFSSYAWSNGANTASISVTQPDNYSVTVSDGSGCTGEAATVIAFPTLPTAFINGASSACEGESVMLSTAPGFSNYLWSNGETTPAVNISLPGDYWVTVTDANGCTASVGQQVSFSPTPTIILTGPSAICVGSDAVFEVTGDFSHALWSTGQQTPAITVAQPGSYSVIVTNADGCTATAAQSLNVSTSLLPNISESTQPCIGIATLNAGTGFANYVWSNGQTSPTITVQQAGNYSVTVSDGSGCTGEALAQVSFAAAPQVNIIGTPTICTGNSTVYAVSNNFPQINWSTGEQTNAINISQAGTYTVTVTDMNGCTATAAQALSVSTSLLPEIIEIGSPCNGSATLNAGNGLYANYWWSNGETTSTINVGQAGNYSVTVSDASGCTGETTHSVNFPMPPQVQVLGPTAFCAGTNTVLSLSGVFTNVLWGNGSTAPSISVSQAGNYAVTVTDANGCTATNALALTALPLPTPVIAPNLGCNGSGTLSVAGVFNTYLWSNGAISPTLDIAQSGNYAVTVTNTSGCIGTDQINVNLNQPPQVSIGGVGQLCEGYTATLSALGSFSQYSWSTSEVTPTITIGDSGQYGLTVTDANGCTATTMWAVAELPTQYIYVERASCSLQDTGTVATILTSFQGCDSIVTVTTALAPSLTSNLTLHACPGDLATFNGVGVLAGTSQDFLFTTALGCDSVVTVAVSEFPAVEMDWHAKASCWNGADGSVTVVGMAGTPPYRFALDGGSLQSSEVFGGLSAGDYEAMVIDKNNCQLEMPVEVPASQSMKLYLENGEIPCGTGFTNLSPTLLSGDPQSINWRWSTGAQTQDLIVTIPGSYSLTANDGCEVQSFSVTVMPAADWDKSYFYVPNSFSPNADGINDYFMPMAGDGVEVRQFEFRVFDRWGNTMFATTDHQHLGWDGQHRSTMMQNALFGWYLKATVADCRGEDLKLFREGGVNAVR